MSEIKLVNYDMKAVATNRNAWLATWKKALADR